MQAQLIDTAVIANQQPSITEPLAPCVSEPIATLEQWQAHTVYTAVQVSPAEDITPLLAKVDQLTLIDVHFQDFNDGRGFSIARKLREAGFCGELRASGNYLPDQLQFLNRCGFNAFLLPGSTSRERAQSALRELNVFYQRNPTDIATLSTT